MGGGVSGRSRSCLLLVHRARRIGYKTGGWEVLGACAQ